MEFVTAKRSVNIKKRIPIRLILGEDEEKVWSGENGWYHRLYDGSRQQIIHVRCHW